MGSNKIHTLLIVDDATENIKTIINIFKNDYTILFAKDGRTALEIAIDQMPDLILLDIIMPDMDGYQVCQKFKAETITRDIPIIFISALEDTIDKVKAFKMGGVDYITKPFQIEEIQARVKTHLSLHLLQNNLEQQVDGRTLELSKANQQLKAEISERMSIEKKLKKKSNTLKNANTALKVILERNDESKLEYEENILTNVQEKIHPYLEKLKDEGLNQRQKNTMDILVSNLNEITSPLVRRLKSEFVQLTTMEIKVADLIKHGRSTKEIANLLDLASQTIESHRKNIRRKLGIKNSKTNLSTYLSSLDK